MKKPLLFLIFAIPLLCMAQNSLTREYDYDAAGNRVLRKTLKIYLAPPDSITNYELPSYQTKKRKNELWVFRNRKRLRVAIGGER